MSIISGQTGSVLHTDKNLKNSSLYSQVTVRRLLTPMRFKTFTWPHNPESYHIEFQRVMSAHKVPFGTYHLQGMGLRHRVMTGQGVFYGEAAYDTFKKLATLFYENTPGALTHPVWKSASVWLTQLSLTQEPEADFVRYAFTFWEDGTQYSTELKKVSASASAGSGAGAAKVGTANVQTPVYHVVRPGDTLWGLSRQYGVTIESIMALNTKIKNPNLIYDGDTLRIK